VVAGFSTHCHWGHLLWHSRFGDVPRYATAANDHTAAGVRERAQAMAAESASGVPLEPIGLLTPDRLEQDWLSGPHQSNLDRARATSS
jgi:hypothetical protein